jgi:hypothetical protein
MRAPGRVRGGAAELAIVLASVSLGACASSSTAPVVFRPEPVPYADTLPIPEPDEQKEQRELRYLLVHGPVQMAEGFDPGEGEALNVTHHDDVVSSAWWERRLGYRRISPAELAIGPAPADEAPADSGPLTVKAAKTEGVTPGFTLKDARGNTYIVKFDPLNLAHLQSAAGVISNRLMWGAGYHVPSDYVFVFDADRLVVDEEATIEENGQERPLTMEDVRTMLARSRPIEGNSYLAFGSKYVPGIPKGPFFFEGTRDDDPNDHFAHQHRRELRALRVFSAWINNTDAREGNTLDVYVKPGYLRHYVIDFGATLGSSSTRAKHPKDEVEHPVDLYRFVGRIATLGFYKKKWEDHDGPLIDPAVGYIQGADFDPESWRPAWTNPAFANITPADGYWAAKILAAFTDEHLRAAVAAGRLPREELVDTLTAILKIRRDRLVEHYFAKVSTVEEPVISRQAAGSMLLSFRDLGLERGLWTVDGTVYDWRFSHRAARRSGSGSAQPRRGADQLVDVTWNGSDAPVTDSEADQLATLEVVTRRPGISPRPATIFLRWDGRSYQVVGMTHGDAER